MPDPAGRHDDQPVGAVVALQILPELPAREGAHRLRRAQHRAAKCLFVKGRFAEAIEDHVVRRVVRGADLLQDDMLLALKLGRVKA